MADNKDFWNNNDDPFDEGFDPSVFGDDPMDPINYADDDFIDYFDEDIVASEIEKRNKMFNDDEDNFGKDGHTQFYSTESGKTTSEYNLPNTDNLEETRVIESPHGKNAIPTQNADDLESTKKLDLKEMVKQKGQQIKDAVSKKSDEASTDGGGKMSWKNLKGRSGVSGGILYVLFVLCAASLIAVVAWIMSTDVLGLGKEDQEVTVTIPKDYTMGEVADILKDNDVIKYKTLFRLFAAISNADEKIEGGTYVLNKNYDYRAIVSGMSSSGGKLVEVEIVIPEGYNMTQIFELLESEAVCYKDELEETAANYDFDYGFLDSSTLGDAKRLEGYLFPDTYKFYMNDSPENVLEKMLDNFESKVFEEYEAKVSDSGYSLRDIITVASIIEKEAAGEADRSDVASVIYNRLENTSGGTQGYLQLDSTINYIIYGTDQEFSTEIDSPYNTYIYKGLPAGPISNPGLAAIEAALNPSDTNYYYFALNKDGVHEFFSSYSAFMDFVNSDDYAG